MSQKLTTHPNRYGPTRTKTIAPGEHDINLIVARYRKTGQLPPVSSKPGVFTDVSSVGDFARVQMMARAFVREADKLAKSQAKAKADAEDKAKADAEDKAKADAKAPKAPIPPHVEGEKGGK